MHDLLDSPWIWQIGVRGVYSHTTLAMREGHEAADVEPPTYNDQPTSATSAPSSIRECIKKTYHPLPVAMYLG